MVSCQSVEMLQIINRVCMDHAYDYTNDLEKLNLKNVKKPVIFIVRVENRRFVMNDWENCFKKKRFFVSLKYNQFAGFLEFCKVINPIRVGVILSKARCTKKWFNYGEIRIYPYCYTSSPLLGYNCYISNHLKIRKFEE